MQEPSLAKQRLNAMLKVQLAIEGALRDYVIQYPSDRVSILVTDLDQLRPGEPPSQRKFRIDFRVAPSKF